MHAELVLENALHVASAECADAVVLGGPVEDASPEGLVPVGRECGRATRLLDGADGVEAVVAIDVAPALDEAAGSSEGVLDVGGLLTIDGEADRTVAVSLLGVGLGADQMVQVLVVLGPFERNVHRSPPCGDASWQIHLDRATEHAPIAHEKYVGSV